MRYLVGASARVALRWLGVQVPLGRNLDVDRLSHPSRFREVSDSVVEVGGVVYRVTPSLWLLPNKLVLLPFRRDDMGWDNDI